LPKQFVVSTSIQFHFAPDISSNKCQPNWQTDCGHQNRSVG